MNNLNIPDSKYNILITNIDAYDQSIANEYHSFSQMENFLLDIEQTYPSITKLKSIGKSYEDRDILMLEISDNPGIDEGEPGVFFMGLHHAREWPSLEICIYIIEKLTNSYDSDPEIKNIVDNRRILVVPCVNPDGYVYSHDVGYDWRKNRHEFPDLSSIGVDLNRNYAGSSNGNPLGSWGTISGSVSHNSLSEVFCGHGPISELETQAVKDVFLNYDLCAAVSWHTYSELVLWPWGYSTSEVTPDNDYMSDVGKNIAFRIETQEGYGTYDPGQSAELYPTTGDTTDWAYGYYHYVLGKPMFAYTIEACSSFHPSSSKLDQIVTENFNGAFYLLNEAENISEVVPRVLPPNIISIYEETDNNIKISWDEKNPKANPTKYQLQELSDLNVLLDDVEKDSEDWIIDGFTKSDRRSNSGRFSYYGSNKQGRVFTLRTKYPILIRDDMKLSFFCNHETQENKNFAFIEVSKDGRYYEIIDILTGDSDGWIRKEYNLDEYVDKSLYIRFRVSGDSFDYGYDGFYFDDIYPVSSYNDVKIISDNIQSKSIILDNKPDGSYYYRIKGYNNKNGWGDYSNLNKILIGNNAPIKPNTPIGISSGISDESYDYVTTTTDFEGDDIFYKFDWGDGTESEWLGPFDSGIEISKSHSWGEDGLYFIRVKAKDIYDSESEWSDPLRITIPKTKDISFLKFLFLRLFNFLFN